MTCQRPRYGKSLLIRPEMGLKKFGLKTDVVSLRSRNTEKEKINKTGTVFTKQLK